MSELNKAVQELIFDITAMVVSVFWGGYVLSVLWGWFAVPIGAVPVGAVHAFGLMLIARIASRGWYKSEKTPENRKVKPAQALMLTMLSPAAMLGIGWIIQLGV